ncbi:hypothetical protein LMH73_015855 [Vibrio splendidus]|nr:hypothetical protein [Vibrio splendidus]MCC4881461.1 hypothetical protein [Vibrio splendidus]
MQVTINNDSKLTLCPNLTSEEDIDNMIGRITSYRKVGIDPRNIIAGYISKDDIDSQHKVLQLLVCLALEEKVITRANMYSDVSIFVNPQNLELLHFEPTKELTIKVHKQYGDKVEFTFKTSDFIDFIIQSISVADNEFIIEDLPNNALLFHACGTIARNKPKEINHSITTGELNILISENQPLILDSDPSSITRDNTIRFH